MTGLAGSEASGSVCAVVGGKTVMWNKHHFRRGLAGRTFVRLLAAIFAVAAPLPAFAYIDPGTGSMLIQSFLAGVAMVAGGVGVFFNQIRSFVSRLRGRDKKNEAAD